MIKTRLNLNAAITITACLLLGACAKSSDNNDAFNSNPVQASEVLPNEVAASGNTVTSFTTTAFLVTPGPRTVGELAVTNEETFVAYPVLRERATVLSTVSRAIETDAGTIDLYDGEALIMTLQWQPDTNSYVVSGSQPFVADSILRTMSVVDAAQMSMMEKLTFVISSCRMELEQQEQEQKQEDK